MHTIKKRFKGYPFAHRQHSHDGHCALIHGHNWDFEICLEATELDENGFVYDFGKFGWLKDWFEEMFDHTCLINSGDPAFETFEELHEKGLITLIEVTSCSSEGLAKMVYEELNDRIESEKTPDNDRGLRVVSVTVHEDYKNSATYDGDSQYIDARLNVGSIERARIEHSKTQRSR